ncbi:fumarylacetoacetate hydrolase family protein [Dethiosulfovibrio sp. F2B]|uniref:fumarylacetoacetate hydrolase family protein n=1 Tax=Dethiosulfovibrio faecalis TaxID=2720018 RepID=UPI001F417709|nr:fumarylacetoacetate hydrolase family protein [Dethiosulfovibrio faecalis]MCF4151033.1 fumarylacetoacetate hydrolase family protein [Dethiosulfovibrio faecalis]
MKFVAFESGGVAGIGVMTADEGAVLDLRSALPDREYRDMQDFIERSSERDIEALRKAIESSDRFGALSMDKVRMLPPIARPIHDVLCVGVNYRDHLEETKGEMKDFAEPSAPVFFTKRAIRIIGDGEPIEARLDLDDQLDYEVELAVIIGKAGADIPAERVEEHVFGYSVLDDLSSRRLQKRHVQWFRGKSLDTYTAMGPVILHKSALPFPVKVDVRSYVNDELRQSSNTAMFIRDIPALVSEISAGMTLEPGDIIATGTPAGVGMGFSPQRFMKRGDTVVCEIPPIGRLVNRVE